MFSLENPIETFLSTTKGVLLSPVSFYRSIFWENTKVTDSLLYAVVCSVIGGVLGQLLVFRKMPYGMMYSVSSFPFYLTSLAYSVIYSLLYLVITAAFIYFFVKTVFHRVAAFPTLLAALAAISAIMLFSWIPTMGIFLSLYALVLTVIAVREVEHISTGKAIIVTVVLILFMNIAARFITFPWMYNFGHFLL